MAAPEKRGHERVRVRYPATLRVAGGASIEAVVENLGAMGALLSTADLEVPMEVGDRAELSIEMGARGMVVVPGEIVRVDQELSGADIRRACAVRFDVPVAHP
jgi:hypothetical protein